MEAFGNLEGLKGSIKTHYLQELEAFKQAAKKEHLHEIEKMKKNHAERLAMLKKQSEIQEQVTYRTALAERELEAKQKYEQRRETLINSVFSDALRSSRSVLIGKRYINMIKLFAKKHRVSSIEGNYKEYTKAFPKFKLNKDVTGIIMNKSAVNYDFTYASFIMSHKADLRQKIVEVLFHGT